MRRGRRRRRFDGRLPLPALQHAPPERAAQGATADLRRRADAVPSSAGGVAVSWQALPVLAAIEALERPSPRQTVARLLHDIAAGIRVLNTRDGLRIPEELIQDRANNLVAGLLGNYRIEEID